MYKWIIVGGGIQGITMASYLLRKQKAKAEELLIIDRHAEPLANWHRCTNTISMPFLRSPGVHHLDVNPFGLGAFAKNSRFDDSASFLGRFKRPSLLLFEEHCNCLIKELSLKKSWKKGSVESISQIETGWQINLKDEITVKSEHLILAIGNNEQLHLPEWAASLKKDSKAPVYHIFDTALPELGEMKPPFTVIGGGITAIHLTLKLSKLFPNQVTLLKRHPFRIHDFDSDPGWLGPKKQKAFHRTHSYQKRRELIQTARYKGSIPRDIYIKLLHQERKNAKLTMDGEVYRGRFEKDRINLYDKSNRLLQQSGTVLLATGFQPVLPGKEWLASAIEENGLKCANCGYPIVAENLQWAHDLFVMGALAELEIRPIARNISGARQAAERITQTV